MDISDLVRLLPDRHCHWFIVMTSPHLSWPSVPLVSRWLWNVCMCAYVLIWNTSMKYHCCDWCCAVFVLCVISSNL